jgi:putative lipoic acid-binding regulatory protein
VNGTGYFSGDLESARLIKGGTLKSIGEITGGSLSVTGEVTSQSDKSLKGDIEVIPNALSKVKSLRGVTFTRKDLKVNKRFTGVIAQEVQEVLPEAVSEQNDLLSVSYGNMVGLLIEGMKEQQEQIDELKLLLTSISKEE